MSSEGPLPPSGALLEYVVHPCIYIHVHPLGPSPMHPMHLIFATRCCEWIEKSCECVMFRRLPWERVARRQAVDLSMCKTCLFPSTFDANKLGSIEDAKQFCVEFVSRMID